MASVYALPGLWDEGAPSLAEWRSRRQHVLDAFAENVYGRTPERGDIAEVVIRSRKDDALGGEAVRIEADIVFKARQETRAASLLVYAPAGARAVPAFLGLNFSGNHAATHEADVTISTAASRIAVLHGSVIAERGSEAERWPVLTIVRRGYAVATMWYEELEVDLPGPGCAADGIRGMFDQSGAESWGAIGSWAWALSRILDALESFEEIDASRVIVIGHSRLGKAALWASAQDERFAGVVSNESGCGGASLFRHNGGEDIDLITSVRPHWFVRRFAEYRNREEALPVDQHQLLALQAPRPTHVSSAIEDLGADPYGEFLSTVHASPVFELFGYSGTISTETAEVGHDVPTEVALNEPYPGVDQRVGRQLSYHVREGKHGMHESDWRHILAFADSAEYVVRRTSDSPNDEPGRHQSCRPSLQRRGE
jgi:hypothetical protein